MNTILRKQFLAHVGQTSPEPMMIEVARAEGVFFYTPEGKRYYDLVAGVSVSNVGHANPRVVEAVQRQAADYMHIMVYGEMIERPQVRYAARIAELLPGELSSVYFVNSGAEAIEGALKLAKRYTHRTELVSMRRAYHGSTQGAMSLMGEPEGEEWKGAFRPLLPDVRAIDFNDFDQLRLITRRTACVVVEPVQGEAGVRPPVPGWLEALRRRCDEVGALLVFDEIQTGLGRTGALFAMQRYGVTPDIVCLAKAFGGGMPLGAFVAAKRTMDALQTDPALGHITTFGGHPVCCAAGLAAFDYLTRNRVVEQVEPEPAPVVAIRTEVVGDFVSGERVEESFEIAGGIERLPFEPEADKDVLRDLLGMEPVIDDPARKGMDTAVIPFKHRFERYEIAAANPFYQFLFRYHWGSSLHALRFTPPRCRTLHPQQGRRHGFQCKSRDNILFLQLHRLFSGAPAPSPKDEKRESIALPFLEGTATRYSRTIRIPSS